MSFLNNLSIQSKLILFLLLVALAAGIPLAWIGHQSGKNALEKNITSAVEGQRNIRRTQALSMLEHTRRQVVTLSSAPGCITALDQFTEAFHALKQSADVRLSEEEESGLINFYQEVFLPRLAAQSETPPVDETLIPQERETRFLQYHYIAKFPGLKYPEEKMKTEKANLDQPYDQVHARFHENLSAFASSFGFEDLMLMDLEGNLVYTAAKTVEFGTNLVNGPYADTHLGELFRATRRLRERDAYRFADFERFIPTLNQPAAFIASPVYSENRMAGVLILQFPIDELSRILTGNYEWQREGLGESGEVYVVGKDRLLRTRTRFFIEATRRAEQEQTTQPVDDFLAELRGSGVAEQVLKRIKRQGNALLALPVETLGVTRALAGQEGTDRYLDYRGQSVVGSYAPLDFEETRWAILAEMDEEEAFAPVWDFTRKVMTMSAAIAVAIPLLGLLLSNLFLAPVRSLTAAAQSISRGEMGTLATVSTRDEFRELADAFNEMSAGLKDKTEELELKVRENEELLLNILPAPAAAKLRGGDAAATQNFGDVTVLFAEIQGLTEYSATHGEEKGLTLLHDLVVAFDDAAEQIGVEKVKTSGATYLAVCGLSVQRPDHTSRVVDFAQELVRIVERVNRDRGSMLRLQVGINAGPVTGGVVGRNKFIYDLWGETVSVARRLGERSELRSSVRLTRAVRERVQEQYPLGEPHSVELPGRGAVETWQVITNSAEGQ
ncbi:MAG: adenylate/guanylate cyclase domain-containing protein [Planctomycetaceae bacterium]